MRGSLAFGTPPQSKDVLALPGRLTGRHLVLMVDEFDRVLDELNAHAPRRHDQARF